MAELTERQHRALTLLWECSGGTEWIEAARVARAMYREGDRKASGSGIGRMFAGLEKRGLCQSHRGSDSGYMALWRCQRPPEPGGG